MSEAAPPAAAPVAGVPLAGTPLAGAPSAGAPSAGAPMAGAAAGPPAGGSGSQRIVELKVSGHLMTLDAGLFCIFQPPGAPAADRNGLPGVRVSAPPVGPEGAVRISTFRNDGWLPGGDGAVLVQVMQGPAQILVTVYQAPDAPAEAAPRLQVLRLSAEPAATQATGAQATGPQAAGAFAARPTAATPGRPPAGASEAEMVAHVQRTGDIGARMGDWLGVRGSKLWIEGFAIAPRDGLPAAAAECLEYQAVLGRDWLSPWVTGGAYCGSRGMALPLLGLAVRLKGDAARTHECELTATFVDGTLIGPLFAGQVAQTESLAPLEAVRIALRPRASRPARAAAPGPAPAAPVSPGAGSAPPAPPAAPAPPVRRKTARRPR